MKWNRWIYLLLTGWLLPMSVAAQDDMPGPLVPQSHIDPIRESDILPPLQFLQELPVENVLPVFFKNTQENRIIHDEYLFPFFEKLCENSSPIRIVHIGDSHVRGHVFTVSARRKLEQVFGNEAVYPDSISYQTSAKAHETGEAGLVYHAIGINGATAIQFTNEEKVAEIARLQPDLIIISFGTNESHKKRYSSEEHRLQMDALLTLLYMQCPHTLVMLTTPPGSYLRVNRRKRVINKYTHSVVETILAYADERHLPVWDLYNIAGGESNACLNWLGGRYMQRDRVHYTHEGYRLQGRLLAEAMIKAFNHYVVH